MTIAVIVFISGCTGMKNDDTSKGAPDSDSNIGKKIILEGKISDTPWQHMINYNDVYPYVDYFDVDGDQLVIYSKEKMDCPGVVRIEGRAIQIKGKSKRPGSEKIYSETQVLVDSWECVK
jgi:hypothetical protein